MSTRDRPQFVRQALRCFAHQTCGAAELVVVDAGEREPVEDLCAGFSSVRYLRAEPGATYGACLNIAAEHARGEILQLLDDDDYYKPTFLDRAVEALDRTADENTIAAWDCFYVLLPHEPNVRFSGHGWSAGATLSFRRRLWERTRFRDSGGSQDWHFIADSGASIERVCAPELYILVRHGENSWRNLGDTDVDTYFHSLPRSSLLVADVVESADADFYAASLGC
ncbi:MAG TPA: glycosyltransferase family A protein [Thermoanaerobaculia bacterium]|nr:glycosyltransferase family A protein [Thermoanaerobaculia bacterium]